MTDTGTTAVRVRNARKVFQLRNTHSLKEALVWSLTGRRGDIHTEFTAVDNVSFELNFGETVGLVGLNGSGKSTMLKLISGVMLPDGGEIGVAGRLAGLIEVGAGFHPDLTGRENVFLNGAILGMEKDQIEQSFDEIVEFSGIAKFIETEVKFYSSGMFLRLAFSVAVHTDPDVFLVDEILAVGDEPFQQKCLSKIRELMDQGKALVIVSHDLDMLEKLCDRGIMLENGRVVKDGPISDVVHRMRS